MGASSPDPLELGLRIASAFMAIAAVCALSYLRVPAALVNVSAVSRALLIKLGDEPAELPPFLGASVTVIGAAGVEGLDGIRQFDSSLTLARTPAASPLTIQSVRVPAGAEITLRNHERFPRTYEVFVTGNERAIPFTVFVRGSFEVTTAGSKTLFNVEKPFPIRFTPAKGAPLQLRIQLDETTWSASTPFRIAGFSFLDVEEQKDTPALFSTLVSGSIRFPGIETFDGNGRQLSLTAGQLLRVDQANGYVRNISLGNDQLEFGFVGEVTGMKTEWRNLVQDHMPSRLAYLSSQEGAKEIAGLFSGVIVLLFTFFKTARR